MRTRRKRRDRLTRASQTRHGLSCDGRFIPTCGDRYPFHGIKPAIGQARCAARCQASGKRRNASDGRFDATGGRVILPEGSVALRLKCGHCGAKRALPSGKIIPVKWVPITAGWYQSNSLSISSWLMASAFSCGPWSSFSSSVNSMSDSILIFSSSFFPQISIRVLTRSST